MDARTEQEARASRKGTRFPVSFDVELIWGGEKMRALVHDISCGGIMISGQNLPPENCPVAIHAIGLEAHGRLVWRTECLAGVAFDDPIDPLAIFRNNSPLYKGVRRTRGVPETGGN